MVAETSNQDNISTQSKINLLDSGYFDYILNSDKSFTSYTKLDNPIQVKVGDYFSLRLTKTEIIISYLYVWGKIIEIEIKSIYVLNIKHNLSIFQHCQSE